MSRFFTPGLLLAAAMGVFVYNQRPDRQVVFPLLDRLSPDPYVQGTLTAGILALLGVAALVFAAIGMLRDRQED